MARGVIASRKGIPFAAVVAITAYERITAAIVSALSFDSHLASGRTWHCGLSGIRGAVHAYIFERMEICARRSDIA